MRRFRSSTRSTLHQRLVADKAVSHSQTLVERLGLLRLVHLSKTDLVNAIFLSETTFEGNFS